MDFLNCNVTKKFDKFRIHNFLVRNLCGTDVNDVLTNLSSISDEAFCKNSKRLKAVKDTLTLFQPSFFEN